MIPVRVSHHTLVTLDGVHNRHTTLIESRWFRSEIVWYHSRKIRWRWPVFEEWGPKWHELNLGRFSIDYARFNAYDDYL